MLIIVRARKPGLIWHRSCTSYQEAMDTIAKMEAEGWQAEIEGSVDSPAPTDGVILLDAYRGRPRRDRREADRERQAKIRAANKRKQRNIRVLQSLGLGKYK